MASPFDGHRRLSTDNALTERLTFALDYSGGANPIYIGSAEPGHAKAEAVWLIRMLTYDGSGNVTDIKLANGSNEFNAIWDNRATLAYS